MRHLFRVMILAAVCLTAVWAADASGKWKSEFTTQDGQTRTTTFTFKANGAELTGTVGNQRGETAISEGKINGDEISFTVVRNFNGNEFKMLYKGKVSADEIKFTVEIGGGDRTFEMTAKKI